MDYSVEYNAAIADSADAPQIAVRETVCKTILNKSSISDYSLNCYTGCARLRLLLCPIHAEVPSARGALGQFRGREDQCRRGSQAAVAQIEAGGRFPEQRSATAGRVSRPSTA